MSPEILQDAIRYWERRRIIYNLVLATVVFAWFVLTWPHFRPALTMQSVLLLLVLAALANLCYCAAYLAEFVVHDSIVRAVRDRVRSALFIAGILFATLFANYWIADEIYPYVR